MAGLDGNCILSLLGRKAESPEVVKLKSYLGKNIHQGLWQMGKTLDSKKGIQLLLDKDNIVSGIKINIADKNQQLGRFTGRLPYKLNDTFSMKGVLYTMGTPLQKGKNWLKYYRDGVTTTIHFSLGNITGLELNYKNAGDLLFDKYCEQDTNTPATGKNINNQPAKGILIIQDNIQAAADTNDNNG
jgi:hypothetical protein